ncbi:MAG: DUF1150 family protein [Alphaproteobacteria bacterium]|jgi:hypothetical protein|nr:DUF1150 family protein [Alphaproteobacteria bacterium]MDP7174382.1 DUF1150 family protein [Alphaproteobacteria bacterium]MDP7232713.1 DUF1150 family protein [Alphaproteobacteria bacterium]|tara:strand:- start:1033 stop:1248 length:216 start_codon:yes stop_codon:yes gene_type:complete
MSPQSGGLAFSTKALASLGLPVLAYVKPIAVDGGVAYAVHGADGRQLAVLPSREEAIGAAIQNELEPLSLH